MKLLAALGPYLAVLIGMHLFRSAWLAILLYHAGILAFLVCRRPAGLWRRMWFGMKNPLLFPGLVVCAMAAPVVYFMWPWFAASETILPEWLATYGLAGRAWLLLIPYFSIVHPALEEVHWQAISPKRRKGLCWQDVLFAGYHVVALFQLIKAPWLFLVFTVLAGSSVFWRWAADRFGGYGLPILTHAAADAAVVVGVHFLLQA
jgi:hypothetical protein